MDVYYHAHGPFKGMRRVVKCTELKYARCFTTQEQAEQFAAALPDGLGRTFTDRENSGMEQSFSDLAPGAAIPFSMEELPLGLMLIY